MDAPDENQTPSTKERPFLLFPTMLLGGWIGFELVKNKTPFIKATATALGAAITELTYWKGRSLLDKQKPNSKLR